MMTPTELSERNAANRERISRAENDALRAADDAARIERLDEDRVVIAGLIMLLSHARVSPNYVMEVGLLVAANPSGESEVARAYRALDAIERTAAKLSPLVPARAVVQLQESLGRVRLNLSLEQTGGR